MLSACLRGVSEADDKEAGGYARLLLPIQTRSLDSWNAATWHVGTG